MTRMRKRILCAVLAAALLCVCACAETRVIITDGVLTACRSDSLYIVLPEGIREIGTSAFANDAAVAAAILPNGLETIGDGAFANCANLRRVTVPESVRRIGNNAFAGCNALNEIVYSGTKAMWEQIEKGSGNDALRNADIICTGAEPQPTVEPTSRTTVEPAATPVPEQTLQPEIEKKTVVGIAWRADTDTGSYKHVVQAVREAGGEPVLLGQVFSYDTAYGNGEISTECLDENGILLADYGRLVRMNRYQNSNAEDVLQGIDAVIFSGGEDICTTLYTDPVPWHGIEEAKNYNATRDVSDYLLMCYCLDNDIPVLGICRGLQMLAIASGADMIQDISVYYESRGAEYAFQHRSESGGYTYHTLQVTEEDSILAELLGTKILYGCPSSHHQAIWTTQGTRLRVTAVTVDGGVQVIEGVERADRRFALGVQFHPERFWSGKTAENNGEGAYMDKNMALGVFRALIEAAEGKGEE